MFAARRALRTFRPRVVLSTGGFVSVPSVIAARGIAPVLTHEQTAVLGLATRINARFAEVLAVSHERTAPEARRLHGHVIVTGNPVRSELINGDKHRGLAWLGFNDELPVLYVTGGARGASPINRRIADILTELLRHTHVVHQTGPASANADAGSMRQVWAALPGDLRARYRVFDFVRDELPDLYAATDLVIARSGAGTIAELAYVGLPAILIPLPGTGGDEQVANANVLGERGAAVVLPQSEATPERLLQEVKALLANPERRARMAEAARSVSQPDASRDLAEALLSLASRPGATPR
jgi:UDP-N-acetylglucosamine--N-acetylmuramyl-(pentapeptide) pyrophosphoryl-undecaprenol N-acetylglucosamine transferase